MEVIDTPSRFQSLGFDATHGCVLLFEQIERHVSQNHKVLLVVIFAHTARIFLKGDIEHPMQAIFNGIITNDKFCLSRIRHLTKMSARKGFPQEIQYPSEATEQVCCPKAEIDEKTKVEHSTLHNPGSRRTASSGSSLSTASPMELTKIISLPTRVKITGESL